MHTSPSLKTSVCLFEPFKTASSALLHILEKTEQKFCLQPVFGCELEFYLPDAEPKIILSDLNNTLKGIWPNFFACVVQEDTKDQYELHTYPTANLQDLAVSLKQMRSYIKRFSAEHYHGALFAAKPYETKAGCGFHIHISFSSMPTDAQTAAIISGLLDLMPASMLAFAPLTSSYDRYRASRDNRSTPSHVAWGYNNRTTAIRIPSEHPKRLEHRVPCAEADPESVFLMLLLGIFHGLTHTNSLRNHPPIYGNAFEPHYDLPALPHSIAEAADCYQLAKETITRYLV